MAIMCEYNDNNFTDIKPIERSDESDPILCHPELMTKNQLIHCLKEVFIQSFCLFLSLFIFYDIFITFLTAF